MGSGIWAYTSGPRRTRWSSWKPGKLTFAVTVPTPFTLVDDAGTHTFDIGYPEWPHQPLVESVVAELRGEGTCPAPGHIAARAAWFADRVLERHRASG